MPAESYLETLDPRLGRVVKEYLEAVERGENPSTEDWINRHGEFAQAVEALAKIGVFLPPEDFHRQRQAQHEADSARSGRRAASASRKRAGWQ